MTQYILEPQLPPLPADATPEQRAEYERLKNLPQMQTKVMVKAAGVEVSGEVDKNDSWATVGMAVVLILSVYLGIKLINKYIK